VKLEDMLDDLVLGEEEEEVRRRPSPPLSFSLSHRNHLTTFRFAKPIPAGQLSGFFSLCMLMRARERMGACAVRVHT
jgi:hypothetical protein